MGSAFEQLSAEVPKLEQHLREMYREFPAFNVMIDSAQHVLATTRLEAAALYDSGGASVFFKEIRAELDRTLSWVLRITEERSLLSHKQVFLDLLTLRSPWIDILNVAQAILLRRHAQSRAQSRAKRESDQDLQELIALTIVGIAAGRQTTG
jgi:phosphoenolpyruvate carboxylase